MADRVWELVPNKWGLVEEGTLPKGLCANKWFSEKACVCRRVEIPRRGVQLEEAREIGRCRFFRNTFEGEQ